MKRFLSCGAPALVLSAALSACGGGGDGGARVILPIDDDAPHAYTTQYLALHPDAVIQPEHLLIVELDPKGPNAGTTSVPLYVRGKAATVIAVVEPPALDNEREGFGLNAGSKRHYYRVAIAMKELWPEYRGAADDGMRIEIFETWLEGDR